MRYELSDYDWGVIRPMLPNKPRGIPRVPAHSQRDFLGLAIRCTVARSAGNLRSLYDLLQSLHSRWGRAGICDHIMEALAVAHNAAVLMIDTSVVRVHQHRRVSSGRLGGRDEDTFWAWEVDPIWADAVEKGFSVPERRRIFQEWLPVENIDSISRVLDSIIAHRAGFTAH